MKRGVFAIVHRAQLFVLHHGKRNVRQGAKMRRKWPVAAAAIPLAFGWALVAAHPAAASTRAGLPGPGAQVQPGGPVSQAATSGGQSTSVSSSNWAGYAATGAAGSFTSVSASWTQPTASCGAGSQYAAFWVGLDGYTSKTVEQIGTEADCTGPSPRYYAWYEVYPGAGVNVTNPVSPGDKFTGTVTSQGNDAFQLVLKDITQGWTQTINATASGADLSSAEAIAEAPSGTSGTSIVLPLTNFGSVGDMASDGSFAVNYTGTGYAQWFGF
jgi:hypothetical protein